MIEKYILKTFPSCSISIYLFEICASSSFEESIPIVLIPTSMPNFEI
mgnify:CR=1 FL=1